MRQKLPVLKRRPGPVPAYYLQGRITCELIGEMDTGEKVWQDKDGNQYLRVKVCGLFAFVSI